MKIIGNSEEAVRLSKEIVIATKEMVEETKGIEQALRRLKEYFLDNEVEYIEDIINKIIVTITEYMDDIGNVKTVMDGYAELLRKRGR